jgi:hypothetical protein
MPICAMRSARILSSRTDPSQNILAMRDRFQMLGINATKHTTKMIYFEAFCYLTSMHFIR